MKNDLSASIDKTNTLPDARPGQCYAKVMVPARYETKQEKVLVREAAQKIETIPAKYEWSEKTVTVKAAHTKLVPEPVKYKKIVQKIETSPAMNIWVTSFNKKAKPVSPGMLASAKQNLGIAINEALPGMCFKEYYTPTQFKTETQEIVVKEASEKVASIPAKYKTVKKQVINTPASVKKITRRKKVADARFSWHAAHDVKHPDGAPTGSQVCLKEIPAKYQTVSRLVVSKPAGGLTIRTLESLGVGI